MHMQLIRTVAVISIAVLLWSMVVGFAAWQYFKFIGYEAQLDNITKIQTQVVQYINAQQSQLQGNGNAAAASANVKAPGK